MHVRHVTFRCTLRRGHEPCGVARAVRPSLAISLPLGAGGCNVAFVRSPFPNSSVLQPVPCVNCLSGTKTLSVQLLDFALAEQATSAGNLHGCHLSRRLAYAGRGAAPRGSGSPTYNQHLGYLTFAPAGLSGDFAPASLSGDGYTPRFTCSREMGTWLTREYASRCDLWYKTFNNTDERTYSAKSVRSHLPQHGHQGLIQSQHRIATFQIGC
jgi:hypothetical protein